MIIKQERILLANLICAGQTQSGKDDNLLGWQDEDVLEEDRVRILKRVEDNIYPEVSRVYSSPLLRSRETSYIIYKRIPAIIVEGLEAFDYGEFEGKKAQELVDDPESLKIISSSIVAPAPKGEQPYQFTARVNTTFKKIMDEVKETKIKSIAIITHRTVVLSVIRRYVIPRSVHRSVIMEYGGGIQIEYDYNSEMARIIKQY